MAFNWNDYQTQNADPTQGGAAPPYADPTLPPLPGNPNNWPANDANGNPIPPPAAGGASAGGASAGGGSVTMADFDRAWQESPYPGTLDGLKQFYAAHPEYAAAGITLGGSKGDKVYGPGGAYWGDAVIGAGTPGGGTGKSRLSGDTGGGQNGSNLGSLGYGFGSSMSPIGQFTPPTEQDALNSPGLQFALGEANRMGQNSAAAKGTLLNGRFQQALYASNIGNALQGYGDVYNRAANTFGLNYDVQKRNQDSPFDKNVTLAKLGAPQ